MRNFDIGKYRKNIDELWNKNITDTSKKKTIDVQIKELQQGVKHRLNELKNMHKEISCLREFIRFKNSEEEYTAFRDRFYQLRKWKQ